MEKTGESRFLLSYAARFVADENFSGAAAGSEATMYTGMGGEDCGYPFVPGVRYLVYAGQQNGDGRLHAGSCSATAPAVEPVKCCLNCAHGVITGGWTICSAW
jgi:hypothetical protein